MVFFCQASVGLAKNIAADSLAVLLMPRVLKKASIATNPYQYFRKPSGLRHDAAFPFEKGVPAHVHNESEIGIFFVLRINMRNAIMIEKYFYLLIYSAVVHFAMINRPGTLGVDENGGNQSDHQYSQ